MEQSERRMNLKLKASEREREREAVEMEVEVEAGRERRESVNATQRDATRGSTPREESRFELMILTAKSVDVGRWLQRFTTENAPLRVV